MIYNLTQYLRNEFPTETFYINTYEVLETQENVPDRLVLLRESAGPETPWFTFVRKNIQVLSRDIDSPKTRALSWSIFQKFQDTGTFGLILPAITVDSVVFPSVQIDQISGVQQPVSLGEDSEGRKMFTFNLQIAYRRVN